jgi:hypothetical protein
MKVLPRQMNEVEQDRAYQEDVAEFEKRKFVVHEKGQTRLTWEGTQFLIRGLENMGYLSGPSKDGNYLYGQVLDAYLEFCRHKGSRLLHKRFCENQEFRFLVMVGAAFQCITQIGETKIRMGV